MQPVYWPVYPLHDIQIDIAGEFITAGLEVKTQWMVASKTCSIGSSKNDCEGHWSLIYKMVPNGMLVGSFL